jgi:hypothetical protein
MRPIIAILVFLSGCTHTPDSSVSVAKTHAEISAATQNASRIEDKAVVVSQWLNSH